MVSAVVGIAVLSAAGGYGVGELTQPKSVRSIDTGPIAAVSATPAPSSPTPSPATTRTPVPNDDPALDPAELAFESRTFTVVGDAAPNVGARAEIAGDVPRHWRKVDLHDRPDWGKFNNPSNSKRSMRYGLPVAETIEESKKVQIGRLTPLVDQLVTFQPVAPSGTTTGPDGAERTYTAIAYTYLPPGEDKSLLYVLTRWVSVHGDGRADVEISVTGLPQDKAALEKIMNRAMKSAVREDL